MTEDRVERIESLLREAEAAHGAYESTELGGVYDREWARWYAAYAVDHDLGELLGQPLTVDEVASRLASAFAVFDALEPKPDEGWAAFVARRLV